VGDVEASRGVSHRNVALTRPARLPRARLSGARIPLLLVCLYVALLLLPKWRPGVAGTGLFFLYALSLPVVLLALVGTAIGGGIGLVRARLRGVSASPRHRSQVLVACLGLAWFAGAFVLARTVGGALPTGSHLREFDPVLWQQPGATKLGTGDITPRQTMLGDVVTHVLPGRSRQDIEKSLGPTPESPYFRSTGRDLIYLLGPERDSFHRIDSEWLLIWLDGSGRFQRYEIRKD